MKNLIKIIFLLLVFPFIANAQTNVSGGIYTNTTWTLAGSPYIVVDTIVVFPGVTLTVDPGVVVKFDSSKYIEIRQGTFIAAGTASDSIRITSNSGSPALGIYKGLVFTNPVKVTIDYCIFKYANYAMKLTTGFSDTITLRHSSFYENNNCISNNYSTIIISQTSFYSNNNCLVAGGNYPLYISKSEFFSNNNCIGTLWGNMWSSFLDSCTFKNNQFGVGVFNLGRASHCIFSNNGTALAIDDDTNYKLSNSVFCDNANAVYMRAHQSHDTIVNCSFSQNHIAIQSLAPVDFLAGNILSDNDTALAYVVGGNDSVFNNYIFHNQVGLLYLGGASGGFFNNYICNNSIYNVMYTSSLNGSIPPVCFCETDSAIIRSKIYDGYVDLTRGLLNFMPFIPCDSSAINALPPVNCPAVITTDLGDIDVSSKSMIEIYPNPTSSNFTIKNNNSKEDLFVEIINLYGIVVYSAHMAAHVEHTIGANFRNGVYFVNVSDGKNRVVKKLIVE